MPPLPKKKHSKRRQAGRFQRYRHVKHVLPVECSQCHELRLPHRACSACGYYNGREVITVSGPAAT
ncbi:MAG: 50S ribosomal protein L32 [SAR202 cluster bacterium]|nr:50S ribosomal protein L32 [SAR202 cluster bacterium]